jgi:hypothetical protein
MNGSIYPTSSSKPGIRGIHNAIYFNSGNITLYKLYLHNDK